MQKQSNKQYLFFYIMVIVFAITMVCSIAQRVFAESYLGRLTVSGTTIDVDVYLCDMADHSEPVQQICDDPNMATAQDYSSWYGYHVALGIADHKHQGFYQLYDVIPGVTTCQIEKPDGTIMKYTCEEVDRNGENDNLYVYDSKGNKPALSAPEDWLWMYTCNEAGWWTVSIVYWKPQPMGEEILCS